MWMTTLYETTKLTIELRDIVDNGDNSVDIFDFDYPCFYEGDAKKRFERKIIDHYYFRQIGQETVGRFLHMFRTRMREIMPYYNQLYESEKFMQNIEDPFATVDYTETYKETSQGFTSGSSTGSSTSSSTASSTDSNTTDENRQRKFSNTPQGSISNIDKYMTDATVENNNITVTGEGSSSGSGESSSTNDTETTAEGTIEHTLTKKGAMGVTTFGHDMIEYRQSFLNIDMMVINELNDLFLGVY